MMIGASELPNRDVKILRFLSDGSNCFYLLGSLYACKIHEPQHFNPSNRIGSDGNMTGKTHGVILISPWFPRCSGLVHWRHGWIQSPSNSNRHVGSLPATSLPRETYGPKKIGLFPFSGFNHFDPHKKIAQMDSQRVCISGSIPFLLLKKCQYLKCFLWAISEIIQMGVALAQTRANQADHWKLLVAPHPGAGVPFSPCRACVPGHKAWLLLDVADIYCDVTTYGYLWRWFNIQKSCILTIQSGSWLNTSHRTSVFPTSHITSVILWWGWLGFGRYHLPKGRFRQVCNPSGSLPRLVITWKWTSCAPWSKDMWYGHPSQNWNPHIINCGM